MDTDGRGRSIWDTFSHTPGRTRDGDTGDAACDHYHRYPEDVALMRDIGVNAYRFSVAWPRIQPEGRGAPNGAGLDHYRRVVDELRRNDIEPVPTLFHWDLPQALEDAGGWPNRDTAERFAEYASIVFGALGDGVRWWITLNEPWVAAWLGYGVGIHAPGRTDTAAALAAAHHELLAHGLAVRALAGANVGIALNLEPHDAASDDAADAEAATLGGEHMNAWFLDPVFGRGYPERLWSRFAAAHDLGFVREGDLETIAAPLGFLGVNYYRRQAVTADPAHPHAIQEVPGAIGAWYVVPPGARVTAMGWPIDPTGLSALLRWIDERYAPPSILVTENGAAFEDEPGEDGRVDDAPRVDYLREHLAAALDARRSGVPLDGYFVWTLLDNFEWAEGYAKRFGLVHVDHATQRRTPKASAHWYRQTIAATVPSGEGPKVRPRSPS